MYIPIHEDPFRRSTGPWTPFIDGTVLELTNYQVDLISEICKLLPEGSETRDFINQKYFWEYLGKIAKVSLSLTDK